jgi:DNA-binding IclR family transcriptional regulator
MGTSPAKGLERMAQIFQCFTEAPEWGVSELADRLGEPKSVIHRSVSTLTAHHYLEQDPVTKRYRLGFMLMRLGALAAQGNDLRNTARPVMESLVAKTGETALLSVFSGNASVCIDKVDAQQRIRVFYEVGAMNPPVVGAAARAILAFLPPERIQQIIREVPLRRYTDNTILDVDRLMAEIREIRNRGYCTSVGEMDERLFGVGAPIFGPNSQVLGSVAVIALRERVSGSRVDELVSKVVEAAKLISDHLGFVGRP